MMNLSESQESDFGQLEYHDDLNYKRIFKRQRIRKRSISAPDDLNSSFNTNKHKSFVELFCLGRVKGS